MLKNKEISKTIGVGQEDRVKPKRRLIPEEELTCVWMTAGVVSYKLCNHEYECETCPFDLAMRKQHEYQAEDLAHSDGATYLTLPTKVPGGKASLQDAEIDIQCLFRDFEGIRLRKSFLYHRGHTWVDVQDPDMVKIGIDEFAGKCLFGIKTVILPALRNRIQQGQVCCWIVTEDGTVPILSPLTGSLAATNTSLPQHLDFLRKNPYEQGWLMQVNPENLARDMKFLFNEDVAYSRCTGDIEKLQGTLQSLMNKSKDHLGPTLCDGGLMLSHVRDAVGPLRYFELINRFFAGK